MDIERIAILGSTGSIGLQALEVAENLGLRMTALAAKSNVGLLEQQARKYRPQLVAMVDEDAAARLREALKDTPVRVLAGMEGLCETAAFAHAELTLNAVVGIAGLLPTLAAIRAKKQLALANKETLVAGGEVVMREALENGVKILPVDSEHSAIFQCLEGCGEPRDISRLILTASGGPFFGRTAAQLNDVTPEQALRHPNWSMGPKITVDCATLMNKGLELIEAVWLFDVLPSQVEVVVHRESVVHSMVEFEDHSVIAQLASPDMRLPIQYALTYPRRLQSITPPLDFARLAQLTFFNPDIETFKCLRLCREAIEAGGLLPAAINAANEAAVELFLTGQIGFAEIAELIEETMKNIGGMNKPVTVKDILAVDARARAFVHASVAKSRH